MDRITHLNIEVTRRCNQRCIYCFNNSGPLGVDGQISLSQWLHIFAVLERRGLKSIHITGGEPFVWPGMVNLLEGAQNLGLDCSILSNGVRIPKLCSEFPDVFRQLKVAQISLDAMDPTLHDIRRGFKGAWRQAIEAINALRALEVPIEISCTVSDKNMCEVESIAAYCFTIDAALIIRPLNQIGRAEAMQLSQVFYEDLESLLVTIGNEQNNLLVSDRFMYVPTQSDNDHQAYLKGILTIECDGMIRGRMTNQIKNIVELLKAA